jgi:hypothetical protein
MLSPHHWVLGTVDETPPVAPVQPVTEVLLLLGRPLLLLLLLLCWCRLHHEPAPVGVQQLPWLHP